jgi:hypothetical protein
MSRFTSLAIFSVFAIGCGGGSASPTGSGGAGGSASAPPELTFEVSASQDVHPISPLIYGTAQPESPSDNRYTLLRSGGNRMTAYNWETNASNAGSDYKFQNDAYLSNSDTPGAALTPMIGSAKTIGATALLTIPIVDYVAGDKNGGGDVRNSGSDYLTTRFKQNRATKGAELSTTPDATDAYVNEDEFVSWVKATTAGGPPVVFCLDNEPDLWASTHAEVHPDPVTYDELCTRNVTYATMVKTVWPTAPVTGFVSYGWNGYETLQNAPDAAGKGEFIAYYLSKMKAAETTAGKRLIDYLDLHWYPEAQGAGVRITKDDTSDAVVKARVQAPRSLWDPSYRETSWISSNVGPIRLIPRLRDTIAANYPGTGLAITEWNYGAGGDISGGVAAADALGVFGREGVGIASYWALASDESFANAAFRAFRNYDGAGATFGDTSIHAASSDDAAASVYASTDAANPARVVIVAINKDSQPRTTTIAIDHPSTFARLAVWTLTAADAGLAAGDEVAASDANTFRYEMPAMSVSVLVPGP